MKTVKINTVSWPFYEESLPDFDQEYGIQNVVLWARNNTIPILHLLVKYHLKEYVSSKRVINDINISYDILHQSDYLIVREDDYILLKLKFGLDSSDDI